MKIAVLGSGVVGITTAYYLARAGAEVVVIDRQPAAALETSFANAGQVSPGYSTPWAAPGIPLKAIKWLFQQHAARDTEVLQACGVPFELLDRAGLNRVEPGLAHASVPLTGGLRLPQDETGDCQLFTTRLAEMARQLGVQFRYDTPVKRLRLDGDRISGVELDTPEQEILTADRYVLAFGSYSRALLEPLQLKLPVYPLKGYSLTIPLRDATRAPQSTVLDETYKIALTRFDQRIRVGGMAEIGGFDLRLDPRRRATLEMVTSQLFPGGDLPEASFWSGLRPMTPDGTPVIGATRYDNLFLNTGHGTLGWTMACGSGQLVADLITGRQPAIRTEGLALDRYQRSHRRTFSLPGAGPVTAKS